ELSGTEIGGRRAQLGDLREHLLTGFGLLLEFLIDRSCLLALVLEEFLTGRPERCLKWRRARASIPRIALQRGTRHYVLVSIRVRHLHGLVLRLPSGARRRERGLCRYGSRDRSLDAVLRLYALNRIQCAHLQHLRSDATEGLHCPVHR